MVRFTCFTLFLTCACRLSIAQTFPAGFTRELISGSISQATAMTMADDGRIFVTQQTGQVRVFKAGSLLPTPFTTVTVDNAGERGLIGITLDPAFATNGYLYIYYTVPGTPAHNRISRFSANGDVATGSELIILELDALGPASIHNGGAMIFGADGKLYVGVGDNSSSDKAQVPETHMGKILRLNPDGSIPSDNPNAGGSAHAARIWGMGVRNPFAFSCDRVTGKIFLIDVGANSFEEINDVTIGGKNYGWPDAEGNSANPLHTNPVYTYPHGAGDGVGCAITGGTFFTPEATNYPASYYGKYFFMDYCEKWINTIDPSANPTVASPYGTNVANVPLYLTTGKDGNLYYLSRSASLYRLVYTNLSPPFFLTQPKDVSLTEGEPASFSVQVIGSPTLTYQWKKNDVAISGANLSTLAFSAVSETDAGTYTVEVSNGAGSVTSSPALLDVEVITGLAKADLAVDPLVFPNPLTSGHSAVLVIRSSFPGQAHVSVNDAAGRSVLRREYSVNVGSNQLAVPTEGLPAGLYLLAVELGGMKHRVKFIISH